MEKVGVVICNYNKENDVRISIQSVLESTYQDLHIYVVDNASTDASVAKIREKYAKEARLTLICNDKNLGGSGGFNTGLREAFKNGHEYLMCVDNDAFLDEKCIEKLSDFLVTHPDTGIAAAKIYHTQEPDYIQQYGSFLNWKDYCVDSTYLNRLEDGTLPEVVYSDAVPACALMIRRSIVEKIGFMPEENFLYWDDTEWCYRCTLAGYRIASVGAAAACHAMGAKKEDVNTFPTYYAWRNWIWFFLKYIPDEQLEDMAQVFLNSIFTIQYEGIYRNESNRAKTVMAALDDALHGNLGKAGEDRIFEMEHTYDPLPVILTGKKSLRIVFGEYPRTAENLAWKVIRRYPECLVYLTKAEGEEVLRCEKDGSFGAADEDALAGCDAQIVLCEDIFRQKDLSISSYYMDVDENILATEEDAFMVANYDYCRNVFLFSQKPLFLRLAREIRNRFPKGSGICKQE